MNSNEWIELFPYGVTMSADSSRPIMLFKDKDQEKVLPVSLSSLDAGITLHQNANHFSSTQSPYSLTWRILKPLKIFLKECRFTHLKGAFQYVELVFEGHPKLKTLEARADEAVSFCLSTNCKFFCQDDYFEQCRILDARKGPESKKNWDGIVATKGTYLN